MYLGVGFTENFRYCTIYPCKRRKVSFKIETKNVAKKKDLNGVIMESRVLSLAVTIVAAAMQ